MSTPEELFWDDFADTYAEIQEESQLPIAKDLVAYLREINLLPLDTFVDFAAGSGKYVAAFYPFVQRYVALDFSQEMLRIIRQRVPDPQEKIIRTKKDQQSFLADPTVYPCIFTAMNPALIDEESLLRFCQKTTCLLILRVVEESEDLFQPFEIPAEANDALELNNTYKRWLDQAGIPWKSQQFAYVVTEVIDQPTFRAYFADDYAPSTLDTICQQVFEQKQHRISTTKIVFELLIVQNECAADHKSI